MLVEEDLDLRNRWAYVLGLVIEVEVHAVVDEQQFVHA